MVSTSRDSRPCIRAIVLCLAALLLPALVQADTAGFGLRAVDLELAGNTGPVSFVIYGSCLDSNVAFEVVDAAGEHFPATNTVIINEWRAIATFDLTGAAQGAAAVVATRGSLNARLDAALNIGDGLTGSLETNLTAPPEIDAGQVTPIYVSYANSGHTDVDIPLLVLTVHGAAYLGPEPTGANMGEHAFILGIPDSPVYTALRPGEQVNVPFYVRLDTTGTASTLLTIVDLDDASLFATPLDYASLPALTPNPSSLAVQATVDAMAADHGPNLGTFYAAELANLAKIAQMCANRYSSAKNIDGRWIMEPVSEPRLTRNIPRDPDADPVTPPPLVTPPPNTGGDGIVRTYAIIIGIDDYDHFDEDGDLKGATTDASLIYNHFRYERRIPDSQIQLFLDDSNDPADSVTSQVLHDAIVNSGADNDDNLVIYFAGHGNFIDDTTGIETDGLMGGLCMSDNYIDNSGMVNECELNNWITEKNVGNTYLIIDACHSGDFVDDIFQAPRTAVLTSAGSYDIAAEANWGENDQPHWAGVYTPFLVHQLSVGESIGTAHENTTKIVNQMDYSQGPKFLPDGADIDQPFGAINPDYISDSSRQLDSEIQFFAELMERKSNYYLYGAVEPPQSVIDQLSAEVLQENPGVEPGSEAFDTLLNAKIDQWKVDHFQGTTTRGRSFSVVAPSTAPAAFLPGGLAASQHYRLYYVTDNTGGRIVMYNPFERRHRRITLMEGLSHPADIDIGDSGRSMVYVANGTVRRTFFGLTAFIFDTSGAPLSGAKVIVQSELGEVMRTVDPDGYITVLDMLRPSLFSRQVFVTVYRNGDSRMFPVVLQPTDQTFVKLEYTDTPGSVKPPTYASGTSITPPGPHFTPGPGDGDTDLPPDPSPAVVEAGITTVVPDIPVSPTFGGSGTSIVPPPSTPTVPGGTAAMPRIVILAPADELVTAVTAHTVVGTVSDSGITQVTLDISGDTVPVPVSGKTFRQAVTLGAGVNTLVAEGTNDKGIQAQSDVIAVTVDPGFADDTGGIAGRVMNSAGYPAEGIRVVEENSGKTTYTNSDGTYRFTGVPAGRASIRVVE